MPVLKGLDSNEYSVVLNIRKFSFYFASFRTGSHNLEVEWGRHHDVNHIMCTFCITNSIEMNSTSCYAAQSKWILKSTYTTCM